MRALAQTLVDSVCNKGKVARRSEPEAIAAYCVQKWHGLFLKGTSPGTVRRRKICVAGWKGGRWPVVITLPNQLRKNSTVEAFLEPKESKCLQSWAPTLQRSFRCLSWCRIISPLDKDLALCIRHLCRFIPWRVTQKRLYFGSSVPRKVWFLWAVMFWRWPRKCLVWMNPISAARLKEGWFVRLNPIRGNWD